jgi:NAD(P)-dependent dehydrogenase (short-subunit alcohol dehydrogenase family)
MGWMTVEALAQAGAAVAILARNPERLEHTASIIRARGGRCIGVAADVRRPDQIAAAFDQADAAFGPPTILANNAGGNFAVLADQMSVNAWRSVTQIALDGTYHCSREFARRRIALGGGGAIVNNSAQYVWSGFPADAHSAAAKAGIVGLTRALALNWAPHRIRVNCVAAGFHAYDETRLADPPADDPRLQRIGDMIPAGRSGRRREFGWLMAFLCSSHVSGVSGQTLVLDGGDRLRRGLNNPPFQHPRERENLW